ncbi:MAG: pyridoxal phosphate-dependent aminotransferase [Actinobacteria bacterium]|nr:pyridoxal phosphate-dependent aminotransferase [Actinomycetota bacterium]
MLARAQELERAGRSVVHLEIGEPDFPTPDHVVAAAVEGLAAGLTHYGATAGTPELREAVAAYFRRTRDLDIEAANCLVGTGAKPFIFFTVLATCGPGDEVIVPDPGFPAYESAVRFAGATPVPIRLDGDEGFRVDPELLRSLLTPRTRLVVLNAPHNPTGGSLDAATVEALAEVLETTDAWVFSDEVYCQLQYDEPFRSIGTGGRLAERLIILDSMSKTYAMTGWRCGFAALPTPLVEPLVRFFVNSTSCVPPFIQHAAVAALEGPQDCVETMREEFIRRRSLIVDGLNAISGVRCGVPAGAFYAFPNVSSLPVSADELADRLLEEGGVATLAGSAFGSGGKDYLRISYANSQDNLREALARIAGFVATL